METISQALQAVQRNWKTFILYAAITVLAGAVAQVIDNAVIGHVENPFLNPASFAIRIGLDVLQILAASVAQSIAFSRMGKEIDRPLWKISGDGEALHRYFPLWFILNVVTVFLNEFNEVFARGDNSDVAIVFLFLFGLMCAIYIPIGACIMFHGRVNYRSLGEYLKPLYRQAATAMVIFLFSGAIVILSISLIIETNQLPGVLPIINIVMAYFDCVVFAATWLLCMYDRQNPEDIEFDF